MSHEWQYIQLTWFNSFKLITNQVSKSVLTFVDGAKIAEMPQCH